jgi:hypothetical protein
VDNCITFVVTKKEMEKFKGTSKSWVSFKNEDDANYLIQSNDGYNLAYVTATYVCDEETKANAKLIAAAPELLKALQESQKYLVELGTTESGIAYHKNMQAINKALK